MGNWDKATADLYLKGQSFAMSRSEEHVLERSSIIDVLVDFKGEYFLDHESLSLKNITKKATNRIEKEIISFVLGKTGGNRTKASKILKINYRTLLNKISSLNIKTRYVL